MPGSREEDAPATLARLGIGSKSRTCFGANLAAIMLSEAAAAADRGWDRLEPKNFV
jgi:hypothetical protein